MNCLYGDVLQINKSLNRVGVRYHNIQEENLKVVVKNVALFKISLGSGEAEAGKEGGE